MKPSLLAVCAAILPLSLHAQPQDLYDIEVIRDFHLSFSQPNYWQLLLNNYASETNIPANLTVDGVTYPNVGVRFRGNTSYFQLPAGSEKRSFNIETDFFVPGQDLYGYEHLNLNNGFHDPTFLREFLTYWVMRRHGPAPLCNFVRVFLNGTYWGVYINVQQPNKDMMRLWFRSNDGNRYRGFPTSGTFGNGRTALTWLGSDVNQYLAAYQAKQGDGTDLMQMINVLNNTPQAQLPAVLPAEFSVDTFYRYAAVMNVCGQTDSYIGTGKDHFLYHDAVHGDFHMFPFDLNEAIAGPTNLDPWYQTTATIKPAFSKTLPIPDWRERYKAHVRNVVEQSFNSALLDPMIRRFHATLTPLVTADTKKIYSTTLFLNNLTQSVNLGGVGGNTIPGLLPFVSGREAYLRAHVDLSAPRTALSALLRTPQNPAPAQPITVTVAASSHASTVRLWWRRLGAFASITMFDDGQHGDGGAGDGTFGASIPGQAAGSLVDYYVEAKTASGLASYIPYGAEFQAEQLMVSWPTGTSPIRINEILAQNVNGIVDENNQHEDWLELYNDSDQIVDVSGMWLTDDLSRPKYQIAAGTFLAARGTLLVWCDEDGTQGPHHANFKLSSGGEHTALFASDATTLLDQFAFGLQSPDVSTGRVLDGSTPWVTFPTPSPRSRNELASCGTRRYGALDSRTHTTQFSIQGTPSLGSSPLLTITSGPASGFAGLFVGFAPAHLDLTPIIPGETLLVSLTGLIGPVSLPLDAQGANQTALSIPQAPNLIGLRLFFQVLAAGGSTIDASHAVELIVCP